MRPRVLSIAGFDPSSGAGVSSDMKTFESLKVYGYGVTTAITYQNADDFDGVDWLSVQQIIRQLELLFRETNPLVVKIGLIESWEVLLELVNFLHNRNREVRIIWDPIVSASAGFEFHTSVMNGTLGRVLEYMALVTPNIPEFEFLFGDCDGSQVAVAHGCHVLLKGGHGQGDVIADLLFEPDGGCCEIKGEKFSGTSKHGTGCVLSAAIAAHLALGKSWVESCVLGKKYVENFILSNASRLGFHQVANRGS